MDAPESPPSGRPSSAAVPLYEDSPVFNFINSLSTIATLKPLNSVKNAQLFKPSDLPHVSSIFKSPQVNPQKESELTTRDCSVPLSQGLNVKRQRTSSCIELSGSTTIASENCSMNCSVNKAPHQSQPVSNDYFHDTLNVPSDGTLMDIALSQHQYGLHRHNHFNENVGASSTSVQSISDLHHASICSDNYLKPVGSPACSLPGIGLHLNAVATISKDIMSYNYQASGDPYNIMPFTINPPILPEHNSPVKSVVSGSELVPCSSEVDAHIQNDHSSQKTTPSAAESCPESHKKKRRKFQNGDGDSCRRCSCKKSKCLKLQEFCSCQGCLNNHTHEEAVLCTRKQIESRNPLAFAPNIVRTCESGLEFGDDSNETPASARHKRGCNCRKSSCLKKYCECFQSGVGCSISCRCESCKNSFGRREGKGAQAKEEKLEFEKPHVVGQSVYLPSTENLLTTPLIAPCRSSVLLPSTCSKPPLSSTGCSSRLHNSQSPMKADVLLPPFATYSAEMFLGNGPSDVQEGDSSCTAGVKVVSPNKKRVSPLRIGTSLSPMGRSGRKLILKSIPSFPSLTGDVNNEPH